MLRIISFVLPIILQVLTSELPEQCKSPPRDVENPAICCNLPRVFNEEDYKECGIIRPSDEDKDVKIGSYDCPKQTCLLKNKNLMKDDGIDKDAIVEFLDKWVEDNPDYKNGIEKTKEICLNSDLPRPSDLCEPSWILFCMREVMFIECPKWEDNENCKKFKAFVEECKPYFYGN